MVDGRSRRLQAEIDRMLAEGHHVEGIVTRLWQTNGRALETDD
jgi:hypothetical protein